MNWEVVILSEAPAKNFRPADFAGRAGAQSKDLLLPHFSMTLNMVKSRSLDSAQPAHQAKGRLDAFMGWSSLGMTLPSVTLMNNPG